MKIFSVKNLTFKGQERPVYYGEPEIKNSGLWHPNSSIDRTLGSYHTNPTNKAYYADPMEPVSDAIKERVDYVVYDNEPKYPDVNNEVSKNYFGSERKNYKKDFAEIRDYYYRREMGGFADKADAQYQQWQAAECIRLYDKGGHLRYLKETTEDEIKNIQADIAGKKADLPAKEAELEKQKSLKTSLNKKIKNLSEKESKYNELKELTKNDLDKNSEETVFISSQISKTRRSLAKYQLQLENCQKDIASLRNYIQGFPKMIQSLEGQIKTKKNMVEDFKAKLIPLFDELKNFYAKQGIRK